MPGAHRAALTVRFVEEIAAYYRHPAVRSRIAEYGGGCEPFPARFSAVGLAGFGGRRGLRSADTAPVPVRPTELRRLFEDGADVCRSFGDRGGTLIQLDVDYVNPSDPWEANRDPAACFDRLEPVYRAVQDALAGFGVETLALMTGRGYHFTARAPLGTPLHDALITTGNLSPALQARYESEEERESLAVAMGAAHEGAGRLVEYLAHEVVRTLRGRTAIPVTAADVPPPARGAFVCLDVTAYGDPLFSRYARCAFSSHQKAAGAGRSSGPPFVIALPRGSGGVAELLAARSDPAAAARRAELARVRLPDVCEATDWVRAYRESRLARFHRRFDRATTSPSLAAGAYAQIDPRALPKCVRVALEAPNPGLLVPTALRAVTLVLWSRGWPLRCVADLVRSRYEAEHGWGDLWRRYAPAARADFYVRLFAGLVVDGLDEAGDFTCASQQQRGGCPGGDCGHELRWLFPDASRVQAMVSAS
jgi:hypothetical protein